MISIVIMVMITKAVAVTVLYSSSNHSVASAPGPVNLTLADDNITRYVQNITGTWLADDRYDCGVLLQKADGQQVAIENCYEALHSSYMCEAIFPPL